MGPTPLGPRLCELCHHHCLEPTGQGSRSFGNCLFREPLKLVRRAGHDSDSLKVNGLRFHEIGNGFRAELGSDEVLRLLRQRDQPRLGRGPGRCSGTE